jgi:hypothetical protein
MASLTRSALLTIPLALVALAGFAQWAGDVAGAQDHALLPRPLGYYISRFSAKPSAEHTFCAGAVNPYRVKGALTLANYQPQSGTTPLTAAEIRSHYRDLFSKAGVRMTCDLKPSLDAMLTRNGTETWISVRPGAGDAYEVVVVEREVPQKGTSQ